MNCKGLRVKILEEVKKYPEVFGMRDLIIIYVGDDYASSVYMRNKVKTCAEVGIKAEIYNFPSESKETDIINAIYTLNQIGTVGGIIVQLPLPKHMNESKILNSISPEKDLDCITNYRVGDFYSSSLNRLMPCTVSGIHQYIISNEISGKKAVVIGRSNIVGRPCAHMLETLNYTVTLCHSKTEDLASITKEADLIVCAVGKKNFLTIDMVKEGATIIDVGINRDEDGKVCGDVDKAVAQKATLTPVPGGVGTLTTAMVAYNMMILDLERRG